MCFLVTLSKERCATPVSLILCTISPLLLHTVWSPSTSVTFFIALWFSDLVPYVLILKTFHVKTFAARLHCGRFLIFDTKLPSSRSCHQKHILAVKAISPLSIFYFFFAYFPGLCIKKIYIFIYVQYFLLRPILVCNLE